MGAWNRPTQKDNRKVQSAIEKAFSKGMAHRSRALHYVTLLGPEVHLGYNLDAVAPSHEEWKMAMM